MAETWKRSTIGQMRRPCKILVLLEQLFVHTGLVKSEMRLSTVLPYK